MSNRAGYDLRPNFTSWRELATTVVRLARGRRSTGASSSSATPSRATINLVLNAGYDITPDWQLYAFGTYGHRNATSAANWRQYNNTAPTAIRACLTPSTTPDQR